MIAGSHLLKLLPKNICVALTPEGRFVLKCLFFNLLFPLADQAIAGSKFISAYQAFCDPRQYVEANPWRWSGVNA